MENLTALAWYGLVASFFSLQRVQEVYGRFWRAGEKVTGAIFLVLGGAFIGREVGVVKF